MGYVRVLCLRRYYYCVVVCRYLVHYMLRHQTSSQIYEINPNTQRRHTDKVRRIVVTRGIMDATALRLLQQRL